LSNYLIIYQNLVRNFSTVVANSYVFATHPKTCANIPYTSKVKVVLKICNSQLKFTKVKIGYYNYISKLPKGDFIFSIPLVV
jgi:hypothetical protein